jgi:hypothetical protein
MLATAMPVAVMLRRPTPYRFAVAIRLSMKSFSFMPIRAPRDSDKPCAVFVPAAPMPANALPAIAIWHKRKVEIEMNAVPA